MQDLNKDATFHIFKYLPDMEMSNFRRLNKKIEEVINPRLLRKYSFLVILDSNGENENAVDLTVRHHGRIIARSIGKLFSLTFDEEISAFNFESNRRYMPYEAPYDFLRWFFSKISIYILKLSSLGSYASLIKEVILENRCKIETLEIDETCQIAKVDLSCSSTHKLIFDLLKLQLDIGAQVHLQVTEDFLSQCLRVRQQYYPVFEEIIRPFSPKCFYKTVLVIAEEWLTGKINKTKKITVRLQSRPSDRYHLVPVWPLGYYGKNWLRDAHIALIATDEEKHDAEPDTQLKRMPTFYEFLNLRTGETVRIDVNKLDRFNVVLITKT